MISFERFLICLFHLGYHRGSPRTSSLSLKFGKLTQLSRLIDRMSTPQNLRVDSSEVWTCPRTWIIKLSNHKIIESFDWSINSFFSQTEIMMRRLTSRTLVSGPPLVSINAARLSLRKPWALYRLSHRLRYPERLLNGVMIQTIAEMRTWLGSIVNVWPAEKQIGYKWKWDENITDEYSVDECFNCCGNVEPEYRVYHNLIIIKSGDYSINGTYKIARFL